MTPDRGNARRDPRVEKLFAAATFYRGACILLLLVVVVETSVIVWQANRARFARAVRIDGKLACFVRNEKSAEEVKNRLLAEEKGELPGTPFLEQKWENLNWPLERNDKVLRVPEAVELLRRRVTIKVAAAAITVGGTEMVVLPDKESAQMTLDLLTKQYSEGEGKLLEASFLEEDLKIADTRAQPRSIVTDVHSATKLLKEPREGVEKYVVVKNDSWRKIADQFGMTVEALRKMNPDMGDIIRIGDKITVSVPKKPLTVVIVKEETREASYEAEPERIETETMPKGETKVVAEAVAGTKVVTERVTYHNGKEVKREQANEVISKKAIAERVMVGTASPEEE